MELGDLFQLRQHLGLLRQDKEGHSRGQLLLVTLCFTGIGVIAGAGGNRDDLHVLQLGRDGGFTILRVVCHDNRYDVAALELTGQSCGEALDGDGDGLLCAVQIIEIRILGGRRVRELGGENIIANGKIRLGVFAHYIVLHGHKAGGEIVGADLGRGDHVPGDELAGVNVLCDADDLRLLTDPLIEQRRDTEADHQRQQNADNADDRAVFENTHGASPPLF